ncbi:MAG: hypothetical protein ACYCYP_12155 [Leptospirales bacterium]
MMGKRISRTLISGSRSAVRIEVSHLLPRTLQPFLSTSHPASLLLFDRGMTFWKGSWNANFFLLLDSGGHFFLPAPPPWTLPEKGHHSPGCLKFPDFWKCLSETLTGWNNGIPPHLDSLPVGLSAEGFQPPRMTDQEYILMRAPWETLQGTRFRAHRWELNCLRREYNAIQAIPWSPEYRIPAGKLVERFFASCRVKKEDSYTRLLLEDQYRAHEQAIDQSKDLDLTGVLLLSGTELLGISWFALLPDDQSAICFLEARNPDLKGVPTCLTQSFFRLFPKYDHLNIQGGSGVPEIEQAKQFDAPQSCSPIFTQSLFPLPSF